ncbi:hypothetical protein B4086_5741 [Bacillus cereus]|nr:hypothetical protein B4086_5741 [Bacillus cereus]
MANLSREKIREQAEVVKLDIGFNLTFDACSEAGKQGKTMEDVYHALYMMRSMAIDLFGGVHNKIEVLLNVKGHMFPVLFNPLGDIEIHIMVLDEARDSVISNKIIGVRGTG